MLSVAVCLLLYSFAVAMVSPWVLLPLTREGSVPRLGVVAWLVAMVSVVASWVTAAAFLIASLIRHRDQPARLATACWAALRRLFDGGAGSMVQAGWFTLAATGVSALAIVGWRLGRSLWRARAHSHGHAERVRVIGRRIEGMDAVVIDAPELAAYCVAGRPNAIVVTSAALDALTDRHLQAVLEHERAHLAGRHHYVLAFARALAAAIPWLTLFSKGAREIARLLEICADDSAARRHGSETLLDALLALSAGAPMLPHGAVGAAATDVLARAEHLATPFAARNQWTAGLLLTATMLLIAGGPLISAALTARGAMWC
jgi:Zn-dependent protease with chaperone function